MASSSDPGILFAYSRRLGHGPRVRLRLSRPRDADAIGDLLERTGHDVSQLQLARLTRFDPRSEVVVCATALVDAHDLVVGIGAISLGLDAPGEPHLLVTDEERCEGLGELLRAALIERARYLHQAHAA